MTSLLSPPQTPFPVLGRLNRIQWFARWPIKWGIFALAYALVCFPYPSLVIRHVLHWSNPGALIEPDAPALQPLVHDLRGSLAEGMAPREILNQVEAFVYRRVPYEWDWNTWGVADYLPTVGEVLAQGREDCDGRAVVAASLLRNLGFDARLVADFAHVWVATEHGETMGPGKVKTVEITDGGLRIDWRGLLELPRIVAYGIAVFPLGREIILLLVLWALLLGRGSWVGASLAVKALLWGLVAIRVGAENYRDPQFGFQLVGFGLGLMGVVMMFVPRQRAMGTF